MAKSESSRNKPWKQRSGWVLLGILILVMGFLFRESFKADFVHFSNDGPLGAIMAEQVQLPEIFTGIWQTLNWVGGWNGAATPTPTYGVLWLLGPVYYAKWYPAISCLVLGLAAWFCCRRLKLGPTASIFAGVAAALNGDFFSYACWGLGSLSISVAFAFLAIGLVGDGSDKGKFGWLRIVLAGFCIGMAVMEGFDNGAIFSLYVAAYVMVVALIQTGKPGLKVGMGIGRVAVIAVCALLIATQVLYVLITTQVKGVEGMAQDEQTREQRWTQATWVSLPVNETPRLFISGLFGYRMDTEEGGAYWGAVGRQPALDEYFDQPNPDPSQAPAGGFRFSGAGFYAGILVCVMALWGLVRSIRNPGETYSLRERRLIWFWGAMFIVSLALSWGRFAPFYQIVYQLPYFSTIRNPVKFLHPMSISLVLLAAYGFEGLWRQYVAGARESQGSVRQRLKDWWGEVSGFDKRWAIGSVVALGFALVVLMMYASSQGDVVRYLQMAGWQGQPEAAEAIASFSIGQYAWFTMLLSIVVGYLILLMAGVFAGKRQMWAFVIPVLFLLFDLGKANAPWVVHYDYQKRYQPDAIVEELRGKAHEGRAQFIHQTFLMQQFNWLQAGGMGQDQLMALFQYLQNAQRVYGEEWAQHQWQYYNIQSLDVVQEPRTSIENQRYRDAFPSSNAQAQLRKMQLANGRYFIGLGQQLLQPLNQIDTNAGPQWREVFRFELAPKVSQAWKAEHFMASRYTNSPLALIEYTGALPRVKLYSNWEAGLDDDVILQNLPDPEFDPHQLVFVSESLPEASPSDAEAGSAEIEEYHPKHVVIAANAAAPSVLLLNDKHDPNWEVTVDGEPADLLRCNFLMRGVFLEPGEHTIEFRFKPPVTGLYVSLLAIAAGIVVIVLLARMKKEEA